MAQPARAPRLRPDQRIAAHITRVGRFARINPAKGRKLPTRWAVLGKIGWAVLVEESLRRARKHVRRDDAAENGGEGVGGAASIAEHWYPASRTSG